MHSFALSLWQRVAVFATIVAIVGTAVVTHNPPYRQNKQITFVYDDGSSKKVDEYAWESQSATNPIVFVMLHNDTARASIRHAPKIVRIDRLVDGKVVGSDHF